MLDQKKLLPCPNPWVPADRHTLLPAQEQVAGNVTCWVQCTCGIRGPAATTPEEAVVRWNRRLPAEELARANG